MTAETMTRIPAYEKVPVVRFDCTRTSLNGWVTSFEFSSPPKVSIILDQQCIAQIQARPVNHPEGKRWQFDAQWLKPLAVGKTLGLELSTHPGLIFTRHVPAQGAKHVMYSAKHNYALVYSPKSACTTLRRLFFSLHGDELAPDIDAPALSHAPNHFPLGRDTEPDFTINVIRHPYHRLVSAFFDKVVSHCYAPTTCTGHDIYQYKFGNDHARWGDLTFMDYLDYLLKRRLDADIHFQTQPVVSGEVEIVHVEQLEDELADIYQRRRQPLASQVKLFLASEHGRINVSANTRTLKKANLPAPYLTPVVKLAELIQQGIGIHADSFLSEVTRSHLEQILGPELAAFSYELTPHAEIGSSMAAKKSA